MATGRLPRLSRPCRAESITASFLIEGAVNAEVFIVYLRQVLCPELRKGEIVIVDNLSTHKAAGVTALLSAYGARVRYLPAYCSDLNPIELNLNPTCAKPPPAPLMNSSAPSPKASSPSPPTLPGVLSPCHYASI
jgi:hypothetical protein